MMMNIFLFVLRRPRRHLLDLFSVRPQLLYHAQQAILIDRTQPFGRDFERDPFVFFSKKKALGLQIGQKPAFCLNIRMGNAVPRNRMFSRDLTYSGHTGRNLQDDRMPFSGTSQPIDGFGTAKVVNSI
jgi:hypothetical protein